MKLSKSWAKENYAILFFLTIQSLILVGSFVYIIFAEIKSRLDDGNDVEIVYEHISVEPTLGHDLTFFANKFNGQFGSEKEIVIDQVERTKALQDLVSKSSELAFLTSMVTEAEISGFSEERLPLIQTKIEFNTGDSITIGFMISDQLSSKSADNFCQMFEPQKMKEFTDQLAKLKQPKSF